MSDTPNHEYNVPDEGDEDWHVPLNENFETLEVDIELRDEGDPDSNGYQPTDGAKYLDTLNGLVYLANGSTWNQVFSFGGSGGGISGLSGGDGINPGTIGDGDTLTAAWGDANDLDADGNVTGGGSGGGISGLSGGDGINPGTIGDGDTLTAAWGDAASLDSGGDISDFSSAASLDSGGDISDFSSAASLDSGGTVNAGRYLTTSGGQVDFNGPAEWSNAGGTGTNTVSGTAATVVGGEGNTASGNHSFAAGRAATANNDGSFVVGDSTSTGVTSEFSDEARFQTSLISESFIESGNTYAFTDNVMLLSTFEDADTGNDVFAVSTPGTYGIPVTQFRVNEFGDTIVTGDLDVDGNKNFVQPVETDDGEKEVVYTASEAAEARTEASGVADVEDGRAVVELPDHFGWVTSDDEPLVVQTTPYASEPVQPQVTERSTDRIVIEDFAGVDEYEVAYTVKGTRAGQEDKQVVREPTATGPSPAPADDD